jgi:hypothetical protein
MIDVFHELAHPWHWLTYGNNAAGIAALAAGAAATFAFRAYRSANEQLTVARKTSDRDYARYLDDTRPHLSIDVDDVLESDANWKWVNVRNIGKGSAVDIRRNSALLSICNSLPSGGSFRTQVQINGGGVEQAGSQTVFLRYRSIDGRRFRTQTRIVGTLCVLYESVVEIDGNDLPAPVEVGARGPADSYD